MSSDNVKRTSRKIPVRTSQFSPHHGMSTLMSRQFFSLSLFPTFHAVILDTFSTLSWTKLADQEGGSTVWNEPNNNRVLSRVLRAFKVHFFFAILILASSDECRLRDLQGISHNKKWAFFDKKNKKECWQKTSGAVQSEWKEKEAGRRERNKKIWSENKKSHFLCVFFAWVLVCWCLPSAWDEKGGVNEMKVDCEVEMMREEKYPF